MITQTDSVAICYPKFDAEQIKEDSLEYGDYGDEINRKLSFYFIQSFQYKTKGRRKDDLIVFQRRPNEHYGYVKLLENPLNREYTSDEM